MNERTRYWCSFVQPTEYYRPLIYPPNESVLGWWCSGYDSNDNAIICALIESASEDDARKAVLKDWPEAQTFRFCDEVDRKWRPNDRFPLKDWMTERLSNGDE